MDSTLIAAIYVIGTMLFGLPSAVVAAFKGFTPWRWLLSGAFPIPGLIAVCCLPSAKARSIDYIDAFNRKARGDIWGTWMACIGFLLLYFALARIGHPNFTWRDL